ncbi:MAG: RcpC/CpaB family pilus assembly protein [Acidimicrobiales bacterium]
MSAAAGAEAIERSRGRVVGARRAVPSSRAIVGGFLVAIAAVGTFAAYRGASTGATHRFVVAGRDVPAGTTLVPGDLTTATVDLPGDLASRAFSQPSAIAGRITLAPINKGELVQSSAVADASKADARYEVSLPVDRARALAGTITSGERVDVAATYGTGNAATTVIVARRAEVVKVDDARRSSVGGGGEVVIELALADPDDVLAVTHASQAGSVTLVRATGADAAGTAPGPDEYRTPLDASSTATGG